jgi:glycerophosphoryl diester phosphodiesterase
MKIVGRKMVENAEVADIRVGENGTTYQTAGAAVRGQFTEVKAQIPGVDASLATAGKAADAKATGDEFTKLNGRLGGLKSGLYGDNITMPFELGLVTYRTDNEWAYISGNTMIRTPKTELVYLPKDTIISLTDYSNAKFYLGWVHDDGTTGQVSEWQTRDYVVREDAYYSMLVSNTTPTAQENIYALSSLVNIYIVGVNDEIKLIKSKVENVQAVNGEVTIVKNNLFGKNVAMPFELGRVTYRNDLSWIYADGDTMIRTPQNSLVHLYVGTIIRLKDYTDARFYVGWEKVDGTPTYYPGWQTGDFTVTEEGFYSLLVSNLTPTQQTSVDELANLVEIAPINIVDTVYKFCNSGSYEGNREINPYILTEKFIAHRGCDSIACPENTIPAFKLAIESGYKMIEYDVRFTSDNVPVLIHDETINRTARNADGTEISETIYVANTTYTDLLQYDFGIWRGSQFAGTKIPTLEEFLIFIKKYNCVGDTDWTTMGNALTDFQMDLFVDTVRRNGMLDSVMFTSNYNIIGKLLKKYPNLMTCIANQGNPISSLDTCANVMQRSRLPIVSLQYPYATKEWHDYAHNLGLYTKTFTPSNNAAINSSLKFSPDLMIVGTLGRNEIIIE